MPAIGHGNFRLAAAPLTTFNYAVRRRGFMRSVLALALVATFVASGCSSPSGPTSEFEAAAILAPQLLKADLAKSVGGDVPADLQGLMGSAQGLSGSDGTMSMDMTIHSGKETMHIQMEMTTSLQVYAGGSLAMEIGMEMAGVPGRPAMEFAMHLTCSAETVTLTSDGLAAGGGEEFDVRIENPMESCVAFAGGEVDPDEVAKYSEELRAALGQSSGASIVPNLEFVRVEPADEGYVAVYDMSLNLGGAVPGATGGLGVEARATIVDGRIVRMDFTGDGSMTMREGSMEFDMTGTQSYSYEELPPAPADFQTA